MRTGRHREVRRGRVGRPRRVGRSGLFGLFLFGPLLCGLLLSAAPAPLVSATLRARYDAWTPAATDTTPLALLKRQALDWASASGQLSALFDDARGYAELRGVAPMPDGGQSVGVWRAAEYRRNAAEAVLVLSDDWCAAGQCRARTRFVLLRLGQPDTPLEDARLVPRIADSDLLDGAAPDCLKGVPLGLTYLPSRYDATLTAMATVPATVRAACEASGVEVALVTRPLTLRWNAQTRKFTRTR